MTAPEKSGFYYPNKMGRILLLALEDVMGKNGLYRLFWPGFSENGKTVGQRCSQNRQVSGAPADEPFAGAYLYRYDDEEKSSGQVQGPFSMRVHENMVEYPPPCAQERNHLA